MRIKALRKVYIVISSHEAAIALLHKQSSKLSSRPAWPGFQT